MGGINHGMKYRANKGIRTDKKEGVSYSNISKKFVVRIKKSCGQISTIAQFENEKEADKCYQENKLKQ